VLQADDGSEGSRIALQASRDELARLTTQEADRGSDSALTPTAFSAECTLTAHALCVLQEAELREQEAQMEATRIGSRVAAEAAEAEAASVRKPPRSARGRRGSVATEAEEQEAAVPASLPRGKRAAAAAPAEEEAAVSARPSRRAKQVVRFRVRLRVRVRVS